MTQEALREQVRLAVLEIAVETGQVPDAEAVAARLAAVPRDVVAAFAELAEAHVYVLDPADPTRLQMANPFSGMPTAFRVAARDREYYGNCIWDALGIVSLLGGTGTVTTACPDCGEELRIEVAGGELMRTQGVVHFSVPAQRWWDDIAFT